jgi:hypothetical protein
VKDSGFRIQRLWYGVDLMSWVWSLRLKVEGLGGMIQKKNLQFGAFNIEFRDRDVRFRAKGLGLNVEGKPNAINLVAADTSTQTTQLQFEALQSSKSYTLDCKSETLNP